MFKEVCARCGFYQFENGYCIQCGLHKNGGKGKIRNSIEISEQEKELILVDNRFNTIKNKVIIDLSNKYNELQKKINVICAEMKVLESQKKTDHKFYEKINELQREKWKNFLLLENLKSRIQKLLREDFYSE